MGDTDKLDPTLGEDTEFVDTLRKGPLMTMLTGDYGPSTTDWVRDQVELYERTDGAEGHTVGGDPDMPVIILTHRGARSGKIRKTPIMRIEHAGSYAAVAAVGGAPTNPAWYHNLLAHPTVERRDRTTVHRMRAREATGAEKTEWIARTDALYPFYPDGAQPPKRGATSHCSSSNASRASTPPEEHHEPSPPNLRRRHRPRPHADLDPRRRGTGSRPRTAGPSPVPPVRRLSHLQRAPA
jgi:deazaflavin-dependent oxidoreductase (nitroreductase family)